jgi:hypothetical protein
MPSLSGQRGAATTEYIGAAMAVSALLVAALGAYERSGHSVGDVAGRSIERSVAASAARARQQAAAAVSARSGGTGPVTTATSLTHWHVHKETRHAHEVGIWNDLTLDDLVPTVGAWKAERSLGNIGPGGHASATATACALCAGAGWRGSWGAGATKATAGSFVAGLRGEGHVSLVRAEVGARSQTMIGPVPVATQARGTANIGLSAKGSARAVFGTSRQELELGLSGVAGATARAEHRTSTRLFGIAMRNTAGVEGWAGVGGRAKLSLKRDGGKISYGGALGGALGLGGAVDIEGSVDVSGINTNAARIGSQLLLGPIGPAKEAQLLIDMAKHGWRFW